MQIRFYSALLFVPILLSLISCSSEANNDFGNPGKEQNVPGWFWSDNINASLKIHIQLPESYDTEPSKKYPVAYLLDADWYFYPSSRIGDRGIGDLVTGLTALKEIPEIILVGICELNEWGNNMRGRDFHSERNNFLNFLQKELNPFIDINYRTETDGKYGNTLIGHSSGGHFALFTLFSQRKNEDTVFKNYISLSGCIEEDYYQYIYPDEEEMFNALLPELILRKKLFIGTGELEEERFTTGFNKMRDLLLSRNYQEFRVEFNLFNGLDHGTIVYPGVEAGLKFIFK